MTALELFERLAPLVAPTLEAGWQRRDLCILATRVVIDVAEYFSIEAHALPVRAIVYNAAYATHVDNGEDIDVKKLHAVDGSWGVGVGFGIIGAGSPSAARMLNKWAGHLVAVADGVYGDFSVNQAEREQHGIITGTAVVGMLPARQHWSCDNASGTRIEYSRIVNADYLTAPDWRDRARRKHVVGALIRQVR